jgi:hypothetical protein
VNPATRGRKAATANFAAAHRALHVSCACTGKAFGTRAGRGLAVAVCVEEGGAGGVAVFRWAMFCWAGGRALRGCTPRSQNLYRGPWALLKYWVEKFSTGREEENAEKENALQLTAM